MEALLKLASAQELTTEEIHALGLYERAGFPGMRLFIVPPTDNVLKQLAPIQKRLADMRPHLRLPYRVAALPQVRRPEHIPEEPLSGIQRLQEESVDYDI